MKKSAFSTATPPPVVANIETDPSSFAQLAEWAEREIGPDRQAITKRGRPMRNEHRIPLVAHSIKTSQDEWKRLATVAKSRGMSSNAMLRTLIASLEATG